MTYQFATQPFKMSRPAFRQLDSDRLKNTGVAGQYADVRHRATGPRQEYVGNPQMTQAEIQQQSNEEAKAGRERSKFMRTEIFKNA